MKNIFITGVSSYLGQNLVNHLADYKFYGLINKSEPQDFPNLEKIYKLPNDIEKFFIQNKISIIIHLATNSKRVDELTYSNSIFETNINLGTNLLSKSINTPIEMFISSGSYSQDIYHESESLYTLSKVYFEKIQYLFSSKYNLKNISFHLGDVYGPKDTRDKLIPYLLNNENNDIVDIKSDGSSLFSPIYIKDVTNQFRKVIEHSHESKFIIQNVTSELISVKDFISIYKNTRSKDFKINYGNTQQSTLSDIDNFKILENPQYTLEKGLLEI